MVTPSQPIRLSLGDSTDMTAEEVWSVFKKSLTDTLSKTCGTKKTGKGQVKQTAWWNDTVKDAIKEKKKLYKVWVKSKLEEDNVKYRLARRHSKRTVRMAKEQSWKTYGQELRELYKLSTRHFYKSGKAMRLRDEPCSPTTVVNDIDGNPVSDEDSIKKRWQEYFKELLNPRSQGNTHNQFHPSYPEHEEPNFLRSEVQGPLQTCPKNEAAGSDGITTAAILAREETGKLATHNIPESVDREESPRRLAACSHGTNLEKKKGQQQKLQQVPRYIPPEPHGQDVRKDP